jgi:hypothetical protein
MAKQDGILRTRFMSGAAGLALLTALVGALLGVGGFTFYYAEGFSYPSSDPDACVNCHMPYMRDGATKVSDHWVRRPLLDTVQAAKKAGATDDQLKGALDLQRKAQWLLNFIAPGSEQIAAKWVGWPARVGASIPRPATAAGGQRYRPP